MVLVTLFAPYRRIHMRGGGERLVEDHARSLEGVVDSRLVYDDDPDSHVDGHVASDVVHVFTPDLALLRRARRLLPRAKLLVSFFGAPLGLARHGFATGRKGMYRIGQAAVHVGTLARTSRVMLAADWVHAISECTATDLRRQQPGLARKLTVIEPGVDVGRFSPGPARALDAAAGGLPGAPAVEDRAATGGRGYALFVGRLERSKGIDLAARELSRAGIPLVVAGTGALARELADAKHPGVTLLGEVDDAKLVDLYRGARLALFPSLYEGYGLVAVEAVACGTPSVASDAFCVRGPASRFISAFPKGDAHAMLAAVRAAWDRKTPAWSAEAARVVTEGHALDVKAREFKALYEKVASL